MTALAAVRRSRQLRRLTVSTSLGTLLFAAFCVTLSIGDFPIPVSVTSFLLTRARVETAQLALVVLAVVLAAVATAAAGPVGFVAFVAPPVARRLTRSPGPALVVSGLAGALLVCLSDLVARPYQLPVGVVTGAIGAPYLIFLLARTNRLGSGG